MTEPSAVNSRESKHRLAECQADRKGAFKTITIIIQSTSTQKNSHS